MLLSQRLEMSWTSWPPAVEADATLEVVVCLENLTAKAGDLCILVKMPSSAREALVTGEWDYLGQLLSASCAVKEHVLTVPYLNGFSA